MLTKTKKSKIVKDVQVHDADTGSTEVQIAILSKRIDELAIHLKKNAKDNHSRRGLLQMVADRKSHMKYLEKKSPRRYNSLVKKVIFKILSSCVLRKAFRRSLENNNGIPLIIFLSDEKFAGQACPEDCLS